MIACAAIIGQENNPLWLETFLDPSQPDDLLRFSYIMHCALDAVDEKLHSFTRTRGEVPNSYLGMLYATDEYKVYGFLSNTRVKFVLALDANTTCRDDELKLVFKRFYSAYVSAVLNPFYDIGTPLSGGKTSENMKKVICESVLSQAEPPRV